MIARDAYASPFVTRWASRAMVENWSDLKRCRTWRRLWIALAEAEKELGLDISDDQILEMVRHRDDVNFDVADALEREIRHDVMAHVRAYASQCPKAGAIIHLGATSCFVTDNADAILMRDGLRLLVPAVARACRNLADFARVNAAEPCLGYTHFQPAQVTTVGKRACLWLQDLLRAAQSLAQTADELPLRGVKGTTGTQASYMTLFDGDHDKVRELERLVAARMGFERVYPVTGQTYPRTLDYEVLTTLSRLALACSKMGADIRLLAGLKEIEEPFGKRQVGSSAMAYKRNPMRSERMGSLCRFMLNNAQNAAFTAAEQWLERTLDDSAVRRLALAEGFLAADSIAHLAVNLTGGLVVNRPVIQRHLHEELPFMATESILMAAVRAGGDRQQLHERIRRHAMEAGARVKTGDGRNDLLERIGADAAFDAVRGRLDELTDPAAFVGRAPRQVEEFLSEIVEPALAELPVTDTGADEPRV